MYYIVYRLAEQHKAAGNEAYKTQDYEKARQCYTEAIIASPGCALYYGNRSAALMMLEKWSLALDDCTKAVQMDECYTKGYLRAAKCHLMLGNPSLSIDYYQKVLGFERGNKQAMAEMEASRNVLGSLKRAETESNRGEHRTVSVCVGGGVYIYVRIVYYVPYYRQFTTLIVVLKMLHVSSSKRSKPRHSCSLNCTMMLIV